MNTPNKLTLLRVILIPLFMFFFLLCGQVGLYLALVTFILATLTDNLDGYLARKHKQVTTFGKLMDPLADKLLIIAALICFLAQDVQFLNAWVVMIIIARELIVTGIRLIAMSENKVIAASMWGKLKTVTQFIMVVAVIVNCIVDTYRTSPGGVGNFIVLILVIIAVAMTVLSGCDYIWKNRQLIKFE